MRAILFRRLEVDGVSYYQLYGENTDFKPDDTFADFDNRKMKDYFYLDADSDIEVADPSLLNLYYDVNGEFSALNDPKLFEKVFNEFKDKFNIVIREIKPVEEIVDNVDKQILFQREAIGDLVGQIYLNQSIMASDLPVDLKLKLKNNILFHGPFGSGKKSIIECLEKEIDIPYADVTISSNLKDTLEDIIKQLLSRSGNSTEASYGIVYIRDNFLNLTEVLGDNVYNAPSFFTNRGPIEYQGNVIDFRTLTFVILFDERVDIPLERTDIDSIMTMADCTFKLSTRMLTNDEKYQVLFSKNGRLSLYQKFLDDYDHKMVIEEESLKRIINECSKVDTGMNILNSIIDGLMKENLLFGIHDVYINEESIAPFIPAIESFQDNYESKDVIVEENKKNNNQEDIVNKAFDEELDKLSSIITRDVIGQDKQVRTILYTILENRRMANKVGLDNPKKFINNILIRGESGSGKTMIVERIAKMLNIPFFIADSTQFTETGWAGGDVTDMLACLIHAANGDIEAAQKGILWIDEIDKKAGTDAQSQHSRGAVLDNLLKLVEGATISVNIGSRTQEEKVLFDTSRLTVGLGGAFEGLEKFRDRRLGSNKMGFGRPETKNAPITGEDYVSYGMKKQFMARFPVRIELNKITKESLIRVMKESESSSLKTEKFKLEDRNIELEYTDDFYEALAEKVLEMEIGNRGIEAALSNVLDSINLIDIKSSEVAKIILNKDVVNNPESVILIKRTKQKKLIK